MKAKITEKASSEATPPNRPRPEPRLPADFSRAWVRQTQSVGHEVHLFQKALQVLVSRVKKGRFTGELHAFLEMWLPQEAPPPLPACFSLTLARTAAGRWRLQDSAESWMQVPAWAGLLHLPALRPFWASMMRAHHLHCLRHLLPQVWFLDSARLPPFATYSGLSLSRWESWQPDSASPFIKVVWPYDQPYSRLRSGDAGLLESSSEKGKARLLEVLPNQDHCLLAWEVEPPEAVFSATYSHEAGSTFLREIRPTS